jgi:ribose transport system substrate-binding protein
MSLQVKRGKPLRGRRAGIPALLAVGALLIATGLAVASPSATPLQQAAAVLKAAQPTKHILVTKKSTKPYPRGSKYRAVFIHCGQPGCTIAATAIRQAIKAWRLGWRFSVVTTTGQPESVVNGLETAIRLKPSVVFVSGFPRTLFLPQLAKLRAMKIPVLSWSVDDKAGEGITFVNGQPKDFNIAGKIQAAWVAVDSKGKAGRTLFVTLPNFTILEGVEAAYKRDLPKYCSGCTVDVMDMPIASLGSDAGNRIVSYLRAHSEVKYIVFSYDGINIGLPAALKAAGLQRKVKFIGLGPSSENLGYIAAGTQAATIPHGFWEVWVSFVDAAARILTGQSPEADHVRVPWYLFTKKSPKSLNGSTGPVVKNIFAEYRALWPK